MRALVTGGAGFIGSHVVERLLEDGHDVRVLDALDEQVHRNGPPAYMPADAEVVVGDVRDRELVRKSLDGVDRVVHLAAAVGVGQSMYEIERYTSVNAIGAAILLEEMADRRDVLAKAVVASSMSIYGEGAYRCPVEETILAPDQRSEEQLVAREWELRCPSCAAPLEPLPTPESKPLRPASIYAIGKRDHEEMFLVWGRAYRMPVTALRFFNVYGPRQSLSNPYTGVAAIFASRLLNGRPPVVFEDGRQTRDFVHVGDIARAVATVLEPEVADDLAVNVGTGRATTVIEIAEALARELGVDIEPELKNVARAGDIRHCVADISLARTAFGFEPDVPFAAGLRELAAWLADQAAEDLVDEATAALAQRGLTV